VCNEKSPDDGQRNCPKHVEFHFKNKFEKLVHLVGLIIRNKVKIVPADFLKENGSLQIWLYTFLTPPCR
jgi:hypothetical protein